MRSLASTILFAAISLFFVPPASAQISLNDLPDAQGNSRFYDDPSKVPTAIPWSTIRPSRSTGSTPGPTMDWD